MEDNDQMTVYVILSRRFNQQGMNALYEMFDSQEKADKALGGIDPALGCFVQPWTVQ
jgi:hypothetical protein